LRKFALLTSACAVLLFANFASAQQQLDFMIGGGTLISSRPPTDVASFQQPAERGGTYPSLSADVVGSTRRLGLNIETSWRYRQATYYGYENYRPIFTDVNALFQPKLGKRVGLDLFAGIGIASNRFNILGSCGIPGGCVNYTSSNHFMEDLGGGVRYRVWRHFFVRPEAHYYRIQKNVEFYSDSVFRVGASIGYTLGPK
jgi:opacity protein-like surface antigen